MAKQVSFPAAFLHCQFMVASELMDWLLALLTESVGACFPIVT